MLTRFLKRQIYWWTLVCSNSRHNIQGCRNFIDKLCPSFCTASTTDTSRKTSRIAGANMAEEAQSKGHDRSQSPLSEREDGPPRKRPRTRAPQPAAARTIATTSDTHATLQPPPAAPQSQIHRFHVQPLHRFKGASASIKRPREVAHFSFDDDHKYVHDDSGISHFVPPPIGADLKEGFETFRHYEDKEDAHLDAMLKALVDTEKRGGEKAQAKADFVTWRGMMTKVR